MDKYRLGFAVALMVFVLDQLAKWGVTGPLGINQIGDQLYFLPNFQFTYTENNGISLGLLNATTEVGRWMLVALTSAMMTPSERDFIKFSPERGGGPAKLVEGASYRIRAPLR